MSKKENIPGYELLAENHAGALVLKDGSTINYGVIRLSDNELVFYTGKGLREMWKPNMNSEEKFKAEDLRKLLNVDGGEKKLMESEHISVLSFDEIARIMF